MSLRPNVYGFNLDKLRSKFGSQDTPLLATVVQKIEEMMDDKFERQEYTSLALPIIMKPQPVGSEQKETEHFAEVINLLAGIDQEFLDCDSSGWNHRGVHAYLEHVQNRLPPGRLRELIERFANGRPFFGRDFDSSWSFYSYLTAAEVVELSQGFSTHPELLEDQDEFGKDLKQWLEMVAVANLDLWVWYY